MHTKKGFTLPEIIIVLIGISLVAALFVVQKFNLEAFYRDKFTKTALNSIYYALEEDYFASHGYYPESISATTLPTVDPELWSAEYHYEPAACANNHCMSYTLRAPLEKESDFVKSSRTH